MFPRYYYGCSIPDGQSVVLTGGELTGSLVSRYTRYTIYTISTLYLHHIYTVSILYLHQGGVGGGPAQPGHWEGGARLHQLHHWPGGHSKQTCVVCRWVIMS